MAEPDRLQTERIKKKILRKKKVSKTKPAFIQNHMFNYNVYVVNQEKGGTHFE